MNHLDKIRVAFWEMAKAVENERKIRRAVNDDIEKAEELLVKAKEDAVARVTEAGNAVASSKLNIVKSIKANGLQDLTFIFRGCIYKVMGDDSLGQQSLKSPLCVVGNESDPTPVIKVESEEELAEQEKQSRRSKKSKRSRREIIKDEHEG